MPDEDQQNDIPELRKAADEGRKARAEADRLNRENAMLRAGIDLDAKAGQYFAKGYDGELTTEAITAEANDFPGALRGAATPKAETEPEADPTETRERMDLASGSTPSVPEGEDPYVEGMKAFTAARRDGTPADKAAAAAFGPLFKAAVQGDKRVLLD